MIESDYKPLFKRLQQSAEYFNKGALKPGIIQKYFRGLKEYPFETILMAIDQYEDSTTYNVIPLVGQIKEIIEGQELKIDADVLIELARKKHTILGLLASREIRSWDLNNLNVGLLRPKARIILSTHLSDWKRKVKNCAYTEYETKLLIKYNLNPMNGLINGECKPDRGTLIEFEKFYIEAKKYMEETPLLGKSKNIKKNEISNKSVSIK